MMAGIKGKHTLPERLVRSFLHAQGLRFALHGKSLPGRPDVVLPRYRAVIFVHGCFWHRHPGCRFATTPSTNRTFWREKFEGNIARDKRSRRALRLAGWRVFTVWECSATDARLRGLAERIKAVPR